jgi:transcriptional regulator with XRE-family HTH domain
MIVGDKIRRTRESLNLSQGDIEARSGLLRCYISRVETGHTVPSLDNLERIAKALGIPLYRLFWEENDPLPRPIKDTLNATTADWATNEAGKKELRKLRANLSKLTDRHRAMILHLAKQMSREPKSTRIAARK